MKHLKTTIIGSVLALASLWLGAYFCNYAAKLSEWALFPVFITGVIGFGVGTALAIGPWIKDDCR